jgi:hypothetical protein
MPRFTPYHVFGVLEWQCPTKIQDLLRRQLDSSWDGSYQEVGPSVLLMDRESDVQRVLIFEGLCLMYSSPWQVKYISWLQYNVQQQFPQFVRLQVFAGEARQNFLRRPRAVQPPPEKTPHLYIACHVSTQPYCSQRIQRIPDIKYARSVHTSLVL